MFYLPISVGYTKIADFHAILHNFERKKFTKREYIIFPFITIAEKEKKSYSLCYIHIFPLLKNQLKNYLDFLFYLPIKVKRTCTEFNYVF